MGRPKTIWARVKAFFSDRANLALENIALRHQLAVLQRSVQRPKPRRSGWVFWLWLWQLRRTPRKRKRP
jgi:hypothetical protein